MDSNDAKRQLLKDKLLMAALPHVIFDGWGLKSLKAGAKDLKLKEGHIHAVFIDPKNDLVSHFSNWADRRMVERLSKLNLETMKVRERITTAVRIRLEELSGYEEALRRSIFHSSAKNIYQTVDLIWRKAGDKSVDFNFYTKRTLLAAVLSSTTLFWLDDKSENNTKTWDFLDRRISDVMKIPKIQSCVHTLIKESFSPIIRKWDVRKTP
jgi:ubiquinone biosynthesis protein COQ9